MVDPTTANTSMSVPIRGSDTGTWDLPVNGNFNILDAMFGGVTTVAVSSTNIVLASSQGQTAILRFTGTLLATISVKLPSIYKGWTIDNQITNSPSSFCLQIVSTSATFGLGAPPGTNDIYYDGVSIKYRNMGQLGEYWDYAASTVPSWVPACSNVPWLNCDGTVISSATYPQLVNTLGTTTLPDSRGRFRGTLNQTTGRLTSAGGGVDGNTILAAGSSETSVLGTSNLPAYTPSGTISSSISGSVPAAATLQVPPQSGATVGVGGTTSGGSFVSGVTIISSFTGSAQGGVSNPFSKVPPAYIGGITMIRTGL